MKSIGKEGGVFATVIPFVFFQIPMLPAIFLMEGGAYSSEIGEAGHPVGAIWLFVAYLTVALMAFAVVFIALPHRAPAKPSDNYVRAANTASVLLLIFYAIPLIAYGPTLLNGQTRYEFLDNPFIDYFNVKIYLGIICAYHGWMFRLTKKLAYLGFFVAVLLVMISWGEKFSGPQYAVTYFVVGLALAGGRLKRIIVPVLIVVPLILCIWAIPTVLADRSGELVAAFQSRLARQAQVFYKVVQEPPSGLAARSTIEVLDYFGAYTPAQNGMNYLKDLYIADELRGVHTGSLAAGYPAIVLSGGVFQGLLVVFFLEIIRFVLMREILIVGLSAQIIILSPVYLYLLNYIGKIYESGNTYLLTSPVFIAMLAIVFVFNRYKVSSPLVVRDNGVPRAPAQ